MDTKVKGLDIKIMRLRAGIRQYDLAAQLGIPPNRLSEIESGRRTPSPQLLHRLLQILNQGKGGSLKVRQPLPDTPGAESA